MSWKEAIALTQGRGAERLYPVFQGLFSITYGTRDKWPRLHPTKDWRGDGIKPRKTNRRGVLSLEQKIRFLSAA